MTARRTTRLQVVPDPTSRAAGSVTAEAKAAFETGMKVAGDEKFASGLRVGVCLMARIAAGDEELAEQLRQLVDRDPVFAPRTPRSQQP